MQVSGFLERRILAADTEDRIGWVLRLLGEPGDGRRLPLNLALVVDTSGSMSGAKLSHAKSAAEWVVRHLRQEDRLAVVTYNDTVKVLSSSGPVLDHESLIGTIMGLRAKNGTNLSGGWSEGVQQVRQSFLEEGTNRVILLTDGLANHGVTDPVTLGKMAAAARQETQGVSTTTIGVGNSYHEDLLTLMAQEGGGAYHYVRSPEKVPDVFQSEFCDAAQLVAQNVTLEITPSPWVKAVRQLSTHPSKWIDETRQLTIRVGDIPADSYRLLGLELEVAAHPATDELPLLSGTLRYLDLKADPPTHAEIRLREGLPVCPEAAALGTASDPEGVRDIALLRIARARQRAIEAADQGKLVDAAAILSLAAKAAEGGPARRDPLVEEQVRQLNALMQVLLEDPGSYGEGTQLRKEATFGSYRYSGGTIRVSSGSEVRRPQ